MRIIGLDLAITAAHRAVVADEQGQFITPVLRVHSRARELDKLLARARGGRPNEEIWVVIEPTGMAWFTVAAYLTRQPGVKVFRVNGQQVADLRRYYKRHAKSDRIDARVLAKLPLISMDKLHQLYLACPITLGCQRGCKQLIRLSTHITAGKNRLRAIDRFVWPGLDELVFSDPFSAAARWFRQHWYHPERVIQAGANTLCQQWQAHAAQTEDPGPWTEALVALAEEVLKLYGPQGTTLDFDLLQAEVDREQQVLALFEQRHHSLQIKVVRPLYRQLHPSRNLETIYGVGQDGAAIYASFIGDPKRFASTRRLRGWSGMVPSSRHSGDSEAQGLHITQAGPDPVKWALFMGAQTARQWDPQIAAIYYDQIVNRGKHHNQAMCTCATHLLDRIFVVLRDDRPYELRDVDGTPVTPQQAQAIIAERYTVPDHIRQRNNKRARRRRTEQRAERKQARESRSN